MLTREQVREAKQNMIELEELHAQREKLVVQLHIVDRDIAKKRAYVGWVMGVVGEEMAQKGEDAP